MKTEEIVQVLEMHLDRVRDLYRYYRERNGDPEETAVRMGEAARRPPGRRRPSPAQSALWACMQMTRSRWSVWRI